AAARTRPRGATACAPPPRWTPRPQPRSAAAALAPGLLRAAAVQARPPQRAPTLPVDRLALFLGRAAWLGRAPLPARGLRAQARRVLRWRTGRWLRRVRRPLGPSSAAISGDESLRHQACLIVCTATRRSGRSGNAGTWRARSNLTG